MLRKRQYTQTGTGTWAADSEISVDIDKVGLITRIDATAEITPSATISAAYTITGGPFRIFEKLVIEGGSHTYITMPGDDGGVAGVLVHNMNEKDGHGPGHPTGAIGAPKNTATPVNLCFHMGSKPKMPSNPVVDNPYDLTAFIPAHNETQLKIVWTTSGNDCIDATVTITSAVLRLTLSVVNGSESEIRAEMARQGVRASMKPAWTAELFTHTAAKSDYTEERDVPLGAFLKRIALMCQDATGDRPVIATDEVTGMSLNLVLQNERLTRNYWHNFVCHNPMGSLLNPDDGADVGGAGGFALIMDLRPHATTFPEYGLDLRGYTTGSVKLGLTISNYAGGDDSLIIYDRYMPYDGPLAAGG